MILKQSGLVPPQRKKYVILVTLVTYECNIIICKLEG